MVPSLYLIPVTLGETSIEKVIPQYNLGIIRSLKFFIVEDVRSARRFLKKCDSTIQIDDLTFFELNKHTSPDALSGYLNPMQKGESVGLLSEAGCPAVADPGALVVALAHQKGIHVEPLTGPSSILLALMGSGFNGQSFAFHGYLPIESAARAAAIKKYELRSYNEDETQIFIETPYRNGKMLEDLIRHCRPATRLCIAANLTCDDEYLCTKTIREWQNKLPDLSKIPVVFLLYK